MTMYVTSVADRNPETERLMLPVCVTRYDIYKEYRQTHSNERCLEKSQFYKLWATNFKHVSHPKVGTSVIVTSSLTF